MWRLPRIGSGNNKGTLEPCAINAYSLNCFFGSSRRPEIKHLVHLQRTRQIMRNEQHRHFAFQLIDGAGKLFGSLLIEPARCLIKYQYLRALE